MSDGDQLGPIRVRIESLTTAGGASLRVATLVIDNVRRANCLSSVVLDAFVEAVGGLRDAATDASDPLRALVVTGAGEKVFVGGADVDEMAALGGPAPARAFITRVHRACDALRRFPVPVIARIQGHTLGAGLELAAACDLRIAADSAVFGMPEVRLGIPSVVEAALLPGLIGWGRTRELLLFGENIDAAQALAWGLVERVVPHDGLDASVRTALVALAASTPAAVRIQKALISRWERVPLDEAVRAGVDAFAEAWEGEEPAQAFAAFRARRRG